MSTNPLIGAACPVPLQGRDRIVLGHGSGGLMSRDLLRQIVLAGSGTATPSLLEDQATLPFPPDNGDPNADARPRLAFTTDSFVIRPLFFPGGNIGQLAVHGTINDLAVGGATPLYLSSALIIEEGYPIEELARITESMRQACLAAGVELVTGDTKVVERGKGDGVFITTSGIGLVPPGVNLSVRNLRPGDALLLSGTIGDHGMAVMSVREGLEFETTLESDTAPLHTLSAAMLRVCGNIHWMRDPTRGGLSSALNEAAEGSGVGIKLDEAAIPVRPEVRGACELLGFDPLYVANEGKLVAAVPRVDADRLLEAMRSHPLGKDAAIIGAVTSEHPGCVVVRTPIGGERVVRMLSGEQLPRIC